MVAVHPSKDKGDRIARGLWRWMVVPQYIWPTEGSTFSWVDGGLHTRFYQTIDTRNAAEKRLWSALET